MPMPKQKPGKSKQNYATPQCFIDPVLRFLGISEFTFDFAAEPHTAKAKRFWTKKEDAFSRSIVQWFDATDGGWGWLNPPYGNIGPWMAKCKRTNEVYGTRIAVLVPASVGSNWYRDYVDGYAYVLFLNGRIPFIKSKPKWLYPKDCMLVLYGYSNKPGNRVWTWR